MKKLFIYLSFIFALVSQGAVPFLNSNQVAELTILKNNGTGTNTTLVSPRLTQGRWSLAGEKVDATPIPFILSEEGDTDTDDVGNMAFAHSLMTMGKIRIIAMVTPAGTTNTARTNYAGSFPAHIEGINPSTNAPYLLRAVNHYYGRDFIPVGNDQSNKATMGNQTYIQDYIKSNYTDRFGIQLAPPEKDIVVMRRALAAEADNSVVMVFGGQLNNLFNLWYSPADTNSALPGYQLVTNKVRELVILGGNYGLGTTNIWIDRDYNWAQSSIFESAVVQSNTALIVNVLSNVPVTFIDSGIELGNVSDVLMPKIMQSYLAHPENTPVRLALEYGINTHQFWDFNREIWEGREGWGQMASLWGAYGTNSGLLTVTGYNRVDVGGTNYWTNNVSGPVRYAHYATDSQSIQRLRSKLQNIEGQAATFNLGAAAKGSRIETDYSWIGRDSTHRGWVAPFIDYRHTLSNVYPSDIGASVVAGLNGWGVFSSVGTWSMTTNLIADLSTNVWSIRYLDNVYGGFGVAGPDGLSELHLVQRRLKLKNATALDLINTNGDIAATIGSGPTVIVGAGVGDGALRPVTGPFRISDSSGNGVGSFTTAGSFFHNSVQFTNIQNWFRIFNEGTNSTMVWRDGNGNITHSLGYASGGLATNLPKFDFVLRSVTNDTWIGGGVNGLPLTHFTSSGAPRFAAEVLADSLRTTNGITYGDGTQQTTATTNSFAAGTGISIANNGAGLLTLSATGSAPQSTNVTASLRSWLAIPASINLYPAGGAPNRILVQTNASATITSWVPVSSVPSDAYLWISNSSASPITITMTGTARFIGSSTNSLAIPAGKVGAIYVESFTGAMTNVMGTSLEQ